jgi:hypothetical protein
LGEPGSGKTTTLLELARDLIARAEKDSTLPIPVVFNLSSWAEQRQKRSKKRQPQAEKPQAIAQWLVNELRAKYGVPSKMGRQWIEKNDLILLLDGLDEVKSEHRRACVDAINDFRLEHGLTGIVVGSRTREYEELASRLKLNGAVLIQPLTSEQIDHYIAAGGLLGTSRSPKGEGKPEKPQSALGMGNRWAVLVGVNEYADKNNYGRLQVCVKDTQAIRDRLLASGYEAGRLRLLIDGGAEPPTRNNIIAALQSVANATNENDLLLFYYSGHGDEAGGEGYLVAHDGKHVALSDTGVSITRVKQIMEQARARAKVIILDACHSGVDFHGKGPQRMSAYFIRRVFEQAQGLAILASCKQGEVSYEWRAQECSVFTHYLLDALEGKADRDEKGFVTVQDANRHVVDGVKLWATQRNLTQTPTLQYSVAGDIVLARLGAEADHPKASDTPETNASPSPRQTSTSASKRGIPADLRQHLRDVLMNCNEFGSHTQLRTVFSNADELRPFRNNLPEATDLAARVDMTISYLVDKRRTDGRNALVLFLRVLGEKYEPEDKLHGELVTLGDQLELIM